MSKEAVLEFVQKISADESLEAEIETAIAGKQGSEAATAIAGVGAKHGYTFTAEEIEAQRQELSDEDLEEVAGGGAGDVYRSAKRWASSGW